MQEDLKEEVTNITQSLKEMDSVLALILKEISFVKEKISQLESSYHGTEESLKDMLDNSLVGLNDVLSNNEDLIGEIGDKKDALKNLSSMLEGFRGKV